MAGLPGYLGKFVLGSTTVNEMVDWSVSGMTNELLEDTQLTDTFKSFVHGVGDGGTVTVHGWYDDDDAGGQDAVIAAWIAKTNASIAQGGADDPKLYFSATGYWVLSAGAELLVEGVEIGASVGGLVEITFTFRVSGGYFSEYSA